MAGFLRAGAVLALATASAAPLAAQDLFGAAVAVQGDQVFVVKPGTGRGPAAVHVYRRGQNGWGLTQRLTTAGNAERGHALNPSVGVGEGTLLVAAGDPDGAFAAHAFTRGASQWSGGGDLALSTAAGGPPEAVTLGSVMRILQPPRRIVAADGRQAIAAVPGGRGQAADVRIYRRGADGWTEAARLSPGDGDAGGFGAAVAIHDRVALVGAPTHGSAGAVFVFRRNDATGAWDRVAVLAPEGLPAQARFGTVLAVGGVLAVGAPGAGAVIMFRHAAGDSLVEAQRLLPDSTWGAAGFGRALALSGPELLVGAPLTDDARGAVFRYTRSGNDRWMPAGRLDAPGLEPQWGFGIAVALNERLLVVGAPQADGFQGRAAVYTRAGDRWSGPSWIPLGEKLAAVTGGEVRCADGRAAQFACGNVDLQAFLTIEALGGGPGEFVTDLWGWVDPETSREYALVGRNSGLTFVDITTPAAPRVLGLMTGNRASLRDVKVYADHAFFVGDGAGNHGLLVFDLARLRTAPDTFTVFQPDAKYDGIASAHNLVVDPEAGFAYPVGASGGGTTCGGGLHIVDIRKPKEPSFAGCFTDTEGLLRPGRTHDAQCVVYRGPDEEHRGKQICFAANETALRIVDVTDKANPIPIAAARYPGVAYVHQGWLTDDQRYFYLDDELDELVGTAPRTRTMIWELGDLDDPVLVGEFLGTTGATDHNLYIMGDRMYQANYQAGMRVIDITDRERPVEVGFFDTTPYEGNPPGFYGAWTAYPFFPSGTVIVSSMGEGLFILKPRPQQMVP